MPTAAEIRKLYEERCFGELKYPYKYGKFDREFIGVLLEEISRLERQHEKTMQGGIAQVDILTEELKTLQSEIERLKSGRFTEEEFQNLCHNFSSEDYERFKKGCEEYQRKLFGEKAKELARDPSMLFDNITSGSSKIVLLSRGTKLILDQWATFRVPKNSKDEKRVTHEVITNIYEGSQGVTYKISCSPDDSGFLFAPYAITQYLKEPR